MNAAEVDSAEVEEKKDSRLMPSAERDGEIKIDIYAKPVSSNLMYRTYGKKVVMSAEARAFRSMMAVALASIQLGRVLRPPIRVVLEFFFPDKRKRDVDNYAKTVMDCLTGVVYQDDSDVYDLQLIKYVDQPDYLIRVFAHELDSYPTASFPSE